MKKENCTQIVATAEVRLGDYVAKLTEENLRSIKDVADFARECLRDSIREYDDFIINHYNENHKDAEVCIGLLGGLRGFVSLFEDIGKIDIKYDKARSV